MLIEDIEKYVIERTEAFKKELNEEVKQMIKDTDQGQVKSIWDLKTKDEEEYYRLYNNGTIVLTTFESSMDRLFRYMGSAFLTKEDAECEVEVRKIKTLMEKYSRPFKKEEQNWYLYYGNNNIDTVVFYEINVGIPCFETKEIALKAAEEIGLNRLKKYWFRVEE